MRLYFIMAFWFLKESIFKLNVFVDAVWSFLAIKIFSGEPFLKPFFENGYSDCAFNSSKFLAKNDSDQTTFQQTVQKIFQMHKLAETSSVSYITNRSKSISFFLFPGFKLCEITLKFLTVVESNNYLLFKLNLYLRLTLII